MTRAGGCQPGARAHSQPDTHSYILISHPPHLASLPVELVTPGLDPLLGPLQPLPEVGEPGGPVPGRGLRHVVVVAHQDLLAPPV